MRVPTLALVSRAGGLSRPSGKRSPVRCAPVRRRGDPELATEGAAQRLAAAEAALLSDANEIRFPFAEQGDRAADPCPSKKHRWWGPAELDEACACPLSGSTEGGGKAGDTRLRLAGLEEMVAQKRVGKHPEETAVVPAEIADVAAERLQEEGLAQTSDARAVAELPERRLLAQSLDATLE